MSTWIPVWHDRFKFGFDLFLIVGALAIFVIGFAVFWQAAGSRTERAFVEAQKYEAIEFCKKDNMTAFVHVESGKVICGGGSYRMLK